MIYKQMQDSILQLGIATLLATTLHTGAFAQNTYTDSLEALIPTMDDTSKVIAWNDLLWHWYNKDPERAKGYGKQSMELAERVGYTRGLINANIRMGVVYDVTGKYDSAIANYSQARKLAQSINHTQALGSINNNIGLVYWNIGMLDSALLFFHEAIELFKETGNDRNLGNAHNNIGMIYDTKKEYGLAHKYLQQALHYRREAGDRYGEGATITNLGLNQYFQKEFDSAFYYFRESISLKETINDRLGLGHSYNNLGMTFGEVAEYDSMVHYYEKALEVKRSMNDPYGTSSTMLNLASGYNYQGEYAKAVSLLTESKQVLEGVHSPKLEAKIFNGLAKNYAALNQFDSAYYYLGWQFATEREVMDEEAEKRFKDMEASYAKREMERRVELQEIQLAQERFRNRVMLFGFSGLIVLLIGGGMFTYGRYRLKERLRFEEALASEQRLRFSAVLQAQEQERKRLAGELHDGLGQLLATAKLNFMSAEDALQGDEEDRKAYDTALHLLDDAFTEVRQVSHNLMPVSITRQGLLPAVQELAAKVNQAGKLRVDVAESGPIGRQDEQHAIAIYRIIQECLNNIIRHAGATQVDIVLGEKGGRLEVGITDNGKGLSWTDIHQSSGIGWKNIFSRLEMIDGKFDLQPADGLGTKINFVIAA